MKLYFLPIPQKAAYVPTHGFYTPSDAFVKEQGLIVEESEVWVSLYRSTSRDSDCIAFSKETGNIIISRFQEYADEGGLIFSNLFDGYLPDEAAFKAVLDYIRWDS